MTELDQATIQQNKKSKKGFFIFLILFLIAFTIAIVFVVPFPKIKSITLELGDNVNTTPTTYLRGASFLTEKAVFDTSNVDNFTPGNYPITVSVSPLTYNYTVTVVDTTAPVITLAKMDDCLAIDKTFSIDDFVAESTDLSNTQQTHFSVGGVSTNSISFSNAGIHEFDIVCSDASGNTARESISIEFDKAPSFLFLSDKYIKTGSNFDAYKYVFAYDDKDGDITSNISASLSQLDTNTPGNYDITYIVKNQKGVRQEQNITVYVGDKSDNNISVDKSDIDILNKYHYFDYASIKPENYNKAKAVVAPASVNISTLNYKTAQGSRATASGGILKITPEYTYLLTNKHVINGLSGKPTEIMIFDKTIIPLGEIKTVVSGKSDIGIIRFSTDAVPDEKLLELKEYTLDKDVIKNLTKDTKVFSLTNKFKQGDDISQTGVIINPSVSSLFDYFYFDAPQIQTSVPAKNGQSGSPLFDYNGNLITIISSTYVDIDGTTVYAYEPLEEVEELMIKIDQ